MNEIVNLKKGRFCRHSLLNAHIAHMDQPYVKMWDMHIEYKYVAHKIYYILGYFKWNDNSREKIQKFQIHEYIECFWTNINIICVCTFIKTTTDYGTWLHSMSCVHDVWTHSYPCKHSWWYLSHLAAKKVR